MKNIFVIILIFSASNAFASLECNKLPIQKDLIVKTKCKRKKTTYSLLTLRGSKNIDYCLLTEHKGSKSYSKKSVKEEIVHSGNMYKFGKVEFFIEFDGRGGRSFLYADQEFTPCQLKID